MISKRLNKSTAKKVEKYVRKRTLLDRFEDLIEDTRFEDPYYYVWRKFKFHNWNPRILYRQTKYGVQNLIRWFPVIWTDRDWDWRYYLEMQIKKLEGMEKSIRSGHHVYGWRDADNIKKVLFALKRLEADDYHENAFINHDRKWGKINSSFGEKDENNCREWIMNRSNAVTDKEKEQERKESRKLFKHSEYMKKQDLEYANKIITKYLFHWWD